MAGRKPTITAAEIKRIIDKAQDPIETLVETGTYRANCLIPIAPVFKTAYSIEASEVLYQECVEKCRDIKNIKLICGDSAKVLPTMGLEEPVCYLLDAHACRTKPPVCVMDKFPLWAELDYIAQRPYHDIVIIDDCYSYFRRKFDERTGATHWAGVSCESTKAAIERYKQVLDYFIVGDYWVQYL